MAKFTRRSLLGAGSSLAGLAACGNEIVSDPEFRIRVGPDDRPGFPGNVRFAHGVASGDPLPHSVIVWTRVTPEAAYFGQAIPISYGVFADAALTRPVKYGQGYAQSNRDYTVKINIEGLAAGSDYWFRFEARTVSGSVASQTGRTRTAPPLTARPELRFAVVSCSNWPFGRFHAYRDIAGSELLDAVIHLGDYLYEYGPEGYGGETGRRIGREHEPAREIISLADYRARHAQYKSDPDLQAAHAAAPWICTWDDHESTNNAYRSGAENHNPEAGEGSWTERKQAAVQAYLEWMPVRDPDPAKPREALYRRFDFGQTASVICLESRLTGRSDEISWFAELGDARLAEIPLRAARTMTRVKAPERTMLGPVQENWLETQLIDSARNQSWQVLANQVIMARIQPPNFKASLTPAQKAAQNVDYIKKLIEFSQLGLPWNLDAWDGFPAARDRLYDSARKAGARLVTLTGDTHTAWANTLLDSADKQRGVEFGCTAVTSPGFATYMKAVNDLGAQFEAANREVEHYDPEGNGWMRVTLTPQTVRADFLKVSDVTATAYTVERSASYGTRRVGNSLRPLEKI